MDVDLGELERTVSRLRDIDDRRAGLMAYRDQQIVAALDAGATWATVQHATGLTARGVQLAIRRARGT